MVAKTTTWRSSDAALSISGSTYNVEENIDDTTTILRINQNTFPQVLHGNGKGLSSCQLGTGLTARSRSRCSSARLREMSTIPDPTQIVPSENRDYWRILYGLQPELRWDHSNGI